MILPALAAILCAAVVLWSFVADEPPVHDKVLTFCCAAVWLYSVTNAFYALVSY